MGVAFLLLWFILCRQLSGEWSANEQYSYGWFVPFFAAFLLWLRWEQRPLGSGGVDRKAAMSSGAQAGKPQHQDLPPVAAVYDRREITSDAHRSPRKMARDHFRMVAIGLVVIALFLLLPVRLFEVANPDWRPLGWIHALATVGITLAAVWAAGGKAAARHFAFPIAFILVAVPWVTPIEGPITQGLMRIVAAIAAETANLSGFPAQLQGSVIRINSGVVGVNEACSGVRSLQTSLMIGLLFGELNRLRTGRRLLLVAGAILLAFLANCGRAFFLVSVAATRGLAAVGQWHDTAGYAILLFVFAGTLALVGALRRGGTAGERLTDIPGSEAVPAATGAHFSRRFWIGALLWLLAIEAGVEAWYRVHERRLLAAAAWTVRWPEARPGFRFIPINEEVRQILRYDAGREGAWNLAAGGATNTPVNATMFFFRWEPGTSSVLRARSHRPDICLPSVGWRQIADRGVREYATGARIALPFRHFAFAIENTGRGPAVAHAFFCLREDKIAPRSAGFDVGKTEAQEWELKDRVRVVREGLRNPGQQMMQLVLVAGSDFTNEAAEQAFARALPDMVQ